MPRAANPGLEIVARGHTGAGEEHLIQCGATHAVVGEREIARRMLGLIREEGEAALGAPDERRA